MPAAAPSPRDQPMPRDALSALARKLRTVDEARLREIAEALGAEGDSGASLDTTDPNLSPVFTSSSSNAGPSPSERAATQLARATRTVGGLQSTLMAKEQENEKLKEQCSTLQATLNAALSRAEALKQEAAALAKRNDALQRHCQGLEQTHRQKQESIEAELNVIAAALEQAEQRALQFKATVKAKLQAQLLVSDEAHASLSTMSEGDMDVVQYIQFRVYDLVQSWRSHAEEKGKALEVFTEHADYTADALRRAQQQLEHDRRAADDEMATLRATADRYEAKATRLLAELQDVSTRYEAAKAKELAYHSVQERAEVAERQAAKLAVDCDLLRQKLEASQQERSEFRAESASDRHGMQNAANELKFVTRENDFLTGRVRELEEEKSRWEAQTSELKQAREAALERLHQEREKLAARYEAAHARETERLRADNQRDLECIRSQSREVADREARALREGRDAAMEEAGRLKGRLHDVELERDEARSALQELQEASNALSIELRATLRAREVELDCARLAAEECRSNQQQLRVDLEVAAKKVEMLRSELYDSQIDSNRRVAELRGQLEAARAKLELYTALDAGADNLLQGIERGDDRRAMSGAAEHARSVLRGIPTAAGLQAEIAALRRQLEAAEACEAEAQSELTRLRGLLCNAGQPVGYFAAALQDKDREVQRLEKEFQALQAHFSELLEDHEGAQADLERLLSHKQDIRQMKELLLKLRSDPNSLEETAAKIFATESPIFRGSYEPSTFLPPDKGPQMQTSKASAMVSLLGHPSATPPPPGPRRRCRPLTPPPDPLGPCHGREA
eukprot:TRINITY_DN332_c0_g1_i1.p1 TRINITY_DN332_c0_g1~~TRINITY_DN332_c0_g1_i1.p1  ORF type:complete len:803 (-),score=219.18 TRINITY_DN332_c0_g1_i1:184-2592(-)